MSLLLDVARVSVVLNLGLLGALAYIWGGNYRRHGATYTLVMMIFAGFLVIQNLVWGFLYGFNDYYISWFADADVDLQLLLTFLCTFETAALGVLAWLTWQ